MSGLGRVQWSGARAARIKIPLENPSCSSGRQGGEDDVMISRLLGVQTELHVMLRCHSFTKHLGPQSARHWGLCTGLDRLGLTLVG